MHLFRKLLLLCLLCPLQLLAKEDPRVRVRFETSLGKFTVERNAEEPRQLYLLSAQWLFQTNALSSRDPRLYDPRRRP